MPAHIHNYLLIICCLLCIIGADSAAQLPRTQALAPVLIGPYDASDVAENHIVWTWFMQPQANDGQEIICDLKVVEILEGQTPEEALRLNPLIILKEDLKTSAWQTNFAARNFLPGHRYAWRVIAKTRDANAKNETVVSESEIWTYTYNPIQPAAPPADTAALAAISARDSIKAASLTMEATDQGRPEDGPGAIEFTGKTRLTLEHNDAIGLLTQAPKNLARWQIEPTLKIFGVPFGLNLLVTTEENTRQSDLTRGAFGSQNTKRGLNLVLQQQVEQKIAELEQQRDSASADSLRQFISMDSIALQNRIDMLYQLQDKDLSENMEVLRDMGIATQEQEIIAQFPSLGFGKVAPAFSRFLFNGVTINGGLAEYNPGNFYMAGAAGKVQREFDISTLGNDFLQKNGGLIENLQLFKNVYSARIGYGRRNGNHIIASILHADDDAQSISVQQAIQKPVSYTITGIVQVPVLTLAGDTLRDPDDSTRIIFRDSATIAVTQRRNLALARQQNTVVGLASYLNMQDIGLLLEGEMNISYFNDEKNKLWNDSSARLGVRSAKFFREHIRHSEYEQIDMMYAVRSSWQFIENSGKLSGGLRYVGGGYQTVGVAALRKDIFRAEAAYSQMLFDRQMRLNAGYSFEEFGYKRSSITDSLLSTIESINAGAELRFKGLPVITFSYSRHGQDFTMERDSVFVNPADSNSLLSKKVNDKSGNVINQYIVSASHLYGGSWLRISSFLSYMNQQGTAQNSRDGAEFLMDISSPNAFQSSTIQVSQNFSFGGYVNIGASGSYTSTYASARDSSQVWSLDCSLIITPVQWLPITIGYVRTRDEHDGQATNTIYASFTAMPHENLSVIFRFDNRKFVQDNNPDAIPAGFTGTTARLITNFRW